MDRQPRIRNILLLSFLGSTFAFPVHLSNYNIVHSEGMNIQLSKSSPPIAILEDESLITEEEVFAKKDLQPKHLLRASRTGNFDFVTKVAHEFLEKQKQEISIEKPIQYTTRNLAGITLAKNSQGVRILKKALETPQLRTPQKEILPRQSRAETKPEKITGQSENRNLTALDQLAEDDYAASKALAAQEYYANTPETFEEKAERVVGRELEEIRSAPIRHREKSSQSKKDVHFVLVGQSEVANDAFKRSQNFARNALVLPNQNVPRREVGPRQESNSEQAQEQESKGFQTAARVAKTETSLFTNPPRQALIAGNLEFSQGLAATGEQRIAIYRQLAGSRISNGRVDVQNGKYEIYVDNPTTGMIVADLYQGDNIIGRGEILLAETLKSVQNTGALRNVKMIMRPAMNHVRVSNIDAQDYFQKPTLNATTVLNDEPLPAKEIYRSVVIGKAEKKNYWGGLVIGSSLQSLINILYPESTIKALQEIIGTAAEKKNSGIIRGTVKVMGKPQAHVRLELASQETRAVYFSAFIPDPSLEETTSNGEFVFVGVPEGVYIVKARINGQELAPQVVPVENGFVSRADFNIEKPSLSEAFVFDLKSSDMISAEVGFIGSSRTTQIQGHKLISFSGSEGVQFLEAKSQDPNYYTTRITVNKSEKEILIPMVDQRWLEELFIRLKVNRAPDTAIIIGTAPESSYHVELDAKAYSEETQIIYFDQHGRTSLVATSVPVGGGFVAVNVNPGMRSLNIGDKSQALQKIITMIADSSAINAIVFRH